ncbi:hypothetical protein ACF0H5_018510 [Mactra antiquata]
MAWKNLVIFIISTQILTSQCLVKLKADVIYIQNENITSAIFRCSAGQGHMFYLNHIITWSKIGRDGQEVYLSLNWDIVPEGKKLEYAVSSQVYTETTSGNPDASPEMYFVLGKHELTPEDHGEFICRLHDFERNLLAEESIPIIVFDDGLAISPYKIEGDVGKDIAINCMQNTSVSNNTVDIHHVTTTGGSSKIIENGVLNNSSLVQKYDFMTRSNGDSIVHNILTLKGAKQEDGGYYVCEMNTGTTGIVSTNASITIGAPKLKVSPLYYLQVPSDSVANFKCECDVMDTAACINNNIVWSLVNTTSGMTKHIYKGGKLLDTSGLYEATVGHNKSSVNLTINGVNSNEEGDYVCTLEDKTTGNQLATASIPVTIIPVSLGAMSLIDDFPANIRFLCTLSGAMWDSHYFDDHELSWVRVKDGITVQLASNGILNKSLDARYSVIFDGRRYYSVLAISAVTLSDYGDYKCVLSNKHTGNVLSEQVLKMYGEGNITLFSTVS